MDGAEFDAVVLAGGRSSRFGGDKLAATVDGVALLDRAVAAAASARRRILVGGRRPVSADVLWTQERPTGGGPAAAVVSGLRLVTAPWVVLLAGDLPYVGSGTLERLLVAGARLDGALLVDGSGRRQHLCSAIRTSALREQAAGRVDWDGCALHVLLGGLRLMEVPAIAQEAHDVDIAADLPDEQERT